MSDTCKHKFKKGKRKGQLCNSFANYDGYCGTHRPRKSTLADFIGEQKPIPQRQKNKKSVFLVTINSNKTLDSMNEQDRNNFKSITKTLFDDDGIFDYLVKRYGGVIPEPEVIVDKFSDYNYEIGEEAGRLHMHGIVDVEHKSNILIDIARLRNYINEVMGYPVHVNVRVEKANSLRKFINYANKGLVV